MFGLVKLAASFDARRSKQYWQLLKRLYGGSEEAVQAIRESGDPNIWHGTRGEQLPQIDKEGLKVGPFREFGKGTFFGDRYTAELYGSPKVTHRGFSAGNIWDNETKESISDPAKMVEWVKKHPNQKEYTLSPGGYVRIARPSELKGTKTLYPDVTKSKVFDMSDGDLAGVASSQTAYMAEHEPSIQRAKKILYKRIQNGTDEEALPIAATALKRQLELNNFNDESPAQLEQKLQEQLPGYLAKLRQPIDEDNYMPHHTFEMRMGEHLTDMLKTPRNDQELNQLQTYGKLRGKRVFDRMSAPQRKEMFFDHQDIAPELLRHENGRPLTGNPPAPKKEEPAPLKERLTALFKQPKEETKEAPKETPKKTPVEQPKEEPKDIPQKQEDTKRKNLFPLYVGIGAGGLSLGGGLAYAAHKHNQKKNSKGVN